MGQAIPRIKYRRSHQPSQALHHHHQEISRPEPPRRLTHISELIDIDQLIHHERSSSSPTDNFPDNILFTPEEAPTTHTDDGAAAAPPVMMIQSPSGNIVSPLQYLERADRVMTLEERKNSIRSNTERRIRVHESLSRDGLRTEALFRAAEEEEALRTTGTGGALRSRKRSDDDDDDDDDVFVLAQEAQEPPVVAIKNLAEKEKKSLNNNPKRRKPQNKGRLSCLIHFWSSRR